MNSPFQPKKLNVPGLMTDDALNEQLKQFSSAGNDVVNSAPPPSSAVDMVDRIQKEYLNKPSVSLRTAGAALPGPLGALGMLGAGLGGAEQAPAPADPQQRAIDVRSNILSDAAPHALDAMREAGGLPAVVAGELSLLSGLGTLSPDEQQAEADKRAADAKANLSAISAHAAMRDKLRNMSDDDAAALGLPVPPGGTQPETADLPSAATVPALKLTPQEQNLYQHHVDNLQNGKFVRNPDGSISTVYQTSVDIQGKTYNFPTVWDGKILPTDEAVTRALKEKPLDQWPSYPSVGAAEARYGAMHDVMAPDVRALESGLTQKEQNKAADQNIVAEAAKRNQEAIAATKDPTLQPTQTWWLNAMQSGAKGLASMGIGTARFATEVQELTRDVSGLDLLVGGGRSNARAWVDTIDATLNKLLPGDKARSKDFITQLSYGTGSMAGFLLGGYVGASAGLPVKASTMILGAATQGDQQFRDAEAFKANGVQKYLALIAGAGIGLTEAIPIDHMFLRADAMTGGLVRRMLNTTVAGSMEEFLQEFGQNVGQDVVARLLYDEKRKFDVAQYLTQGVVGALTGGLTGAAITAMHDAGVSPQPADQTPPEERQKVVQRVLDAIQKQLDVLVAEPVDQPLANIAQPAPAAPQKIVQGPGGNIPVNEAGQFEAHHESGQQLDVIDPAKRGTGPLRGGERNRLFGPDAVDRSYFGVGDPNFVRPKGQPYKLNTDPYHGEGLGPLRHTIEADPAYRKLLEAGGYDINAIASSSRGADGADAAGGSPLSAEGSGFAQAAFDRHLRRAAERLDALRNRRAAAEADTSVATDQTFFPDNGAARQNELDHLTAADRAFLDEGLLATTAANRAPMAGEPKRPQAGIASATNPEQLGVSLAGISETFTKLLGLTVRQGRLTLKGGAVGQYSRKQDVVRLKTQNDLSTLVHEGGHGIYFNAGDNLKIFIAGNDAALMKVADDLYGGDTNVMPKATHIAEGFAEFFRVYTLNRPYAETHYPALVTEFDSVLDKDAPQLKKGLSLIGQQYAAWLQLPSVQLVRNMIVSGRQQDGVNAALRELHDAGFATWMHEYSRRAVDASLNRYAALNDVVSQMLNLGQENKGKAIDLKRADDPRILQRLATNAGARAMVQTTDGVMGYNSTEPMTRGLREAMLRYHGKSVDQNLFSIDPVRQADFATYIVSLRGIDEYRRLAEGKIERPPLNATLGDLQVVVKEMEAKYGTAFTEAAKITHEYGMGLWQKAYDAGLMTEETYTDGLDRQFYVPLQRDMSDRKASLGASALTGSTSLVKRFRGSDRDIVDPMDVLMHKTFALEKIISRNEVFRTLGALADRTGKAGAMVERIPSKQLMGRQLSVKEVARQLTKDDTISAADAQDLMDILQASIENDNTIDMFRSEPVQTKGENVLFGWENGRLAALQLADGDLGADVVNVINGLGRENLPLFTSIISSTTTIFRAGIVSWPDFLAANFIKDQFSAFILTDVGFKPFYSGVKGAFDELRQRNWAKQYNAAMGAMGGMNVANLHKARIDRDIASLKRKGYLAKAFTEGGVGGALKGLASLVELTETGTRIGVFRAAYERAKVDGLSDWEASIEGSYTATDMMDFGLNGSRMLLFRKTIPFLNAQLQGLYKMMRTLGADEVRQRKGLNFALRAYFKSMKNIDLSRTEKQAINTGRKAWIKMASLGLISAALHFLFRDDPDYQNAGEYLRVTGWVIPLGDGRLFYIPKPYELAVLANFTERALESSEGDQEAMHRFMRGLAMTFVPPIAPPSIQTAVELAANKDFFTGNEIVPSYMQALTPELQFNNYTSQLAKQLGHATGMSPMKIDHVMSSLGATAYRDLMSMYNSTDPNRGSMPAADVPILRRFIRDARRGSTTSRDFWRVASTLNGSLRSAEVTYKAFLEAGNEHAANDFLNTLGEDEKAYAILTTDFKADAKRLNPFYRGRQLSTIVSAMRREMVTELGLDDTTTKVSGQIKLTAKEKGDLDTALSEYAQREMRNTLVAMDAPGWAGKKMVDTKTTINLIGRIEPRVRDELQRRIAKANVYSFKTVNQYWPEVKNRLLRDRENTFLLDILAIAKATQ